MEKGNSKKVKNRTIKNEIKQEKSQKWKKEIQKK